MTKLAASNEILAASFLGNCGADDKRALQSDPKGFLLAKANIAIADDVHIGFVDNDTSTVHLALPYYSILDSADSQALNDESLSETSGGEIFFIALGLAVGGSVLGGAGTGIAAVAKASEGKNLDDSAK